VNEIHWRFSEKFHCLKNIYIYIYIYIFFLKGFAVLVECILSKFNPCAKVKEQAVRCFYSFLPTHGTTIKVSHQTEKEGTLEIFSGIFFF
jgi:hypothetical protein